jgi:hypothetical protein
MIKQRSFTPGDDAADGPDTTSAAFLDALRTRAMDDLHEASLEYGMVLKDLAVIDRKFFGAIAETSTFFFSLFFVAGADTLATLQWTNLPLELCKRKSRYDDRTSAGAVPTHHSLWNTGLQR